MPLNDASTALGQKSTRLLDRVAQNKDLTCAFQAMLWILANTAAERGAKMDGIQIGEVTMTENRIRAHVTFHSVSIASQRYIRPDGADLASHIGQENQDLFVFIKANPDIPAMLLGIVERMDAYARDKGRDFSGLQFSAGFMDRDDNFILEILKESFRG